MSRHPCVAFLLPLLTLALALAGPPAAMAGAYRCTSATGELTFSDRPCPPDAPRQQAVRIPTPAPAPPPGTGRATPADDPYSIVNQARMIERREAQEAARRAADAAATQAAVPAQPAAPNGPALPVMTYEQARRQALKDAGYHQYGNLNRLQKERVDNEMSKYSYLPPTPQPAEQNAAAAQPSL